MALRFVIIPLLLSRVTGNLNLQGSAPSSGSPSTSPSTTSAVGTVQDVIDLTRGFSSSQVCPWLFSKTGLFIIKNSIQGSAPGSIVGTDQDVIDLTGGFSRSQVSLSWHFVSQL